MQGLIFITQPHTNIKQYHIFQHYMNELAVCVGVGVHTCTGDIEKEHSHIMGSD